MDALAASCDCGGSGLGALPAASPLQVWAAGVLSRAAPRGGQSWAAGSIPRSPLGAAAVHLSDCQPRLFLCVQHGGGDLSPPAPSLNLPCRSGSGRGSELGLPPPPESRRRVAFPRSPSACCALLGTEPWAMQTGSPGVTIPRSMRPGGPCGLPGAGASPGAGNAVLGVFNEPPEEGRLGQGSRGPGRLGGRGGGACPPGRMARQHLSVSSW